MPVAKNQSMIDIGSEIMYLIRFVKLQSRKKFPPKPHAKETAFNAISLNRLTLVILIYALAPLTIEDLVCRHPAHQLHLVVLHCRPVETSSL